MESVRRQGLNSGNKRNIMLVTSSLYFGGAQKVTYLLADGLSDMFNVTVVYCFDSGYSYPFNERISIRKLPEYDRNAGVCEKMICVRKQVKALRALKRELDIDAALSLGNIANYLNVMSRDNDRVICSERSNPKRSWGKWFYHITRILYERADCLIFQSEKIRALYGKNVREKSCILKNPLLRPEPAYEHREKKIVNLGRFTTQKNHDLLIRSFAQFHKEYPEYRPSS